MMGAQINTDQLKETECWLMPAKQPDAFLLVGDAVSGPCRIDDSNLPRSRIPRERSRQLRIVHLNDLHGQVARSTSHQEMPVLSRIATYIQSVREQVATTEDTDLLVLSAGDDIGGSPLDLLLTASPGHEKPHPVYSLLAGLGLNAAAVGNHDLDFGEAPLIAAAREIDYPFVSANLTGTSELADTIYPAVIFILSGVRVGIIGLTTPSRMKHLVGSAWRVADPVRTLNNLLPSFRSLCDVVVLLSHLGYQGTAAKSGGVVGDVELARMLPPGSVNLIIGGHSHDALNEDGIHPANIVNGIPIVQAGAFGRYIGDVTLKVHDRDGRLRIRVTDAHLIHTADLGVDEAFEISRVQPILAGMRPLLERTIGAVDVDPTLQTRHVRECFDAGELALANFVTDALVDRCHDNGFAVDLAMIDASVLRAGLPDRESLRLEDWFRVMPYTDSIECFELTGQQLLDLLSDNVYRLGRLDEPAVERGFAQFSRQIRYRAIHGQTRRETILVNPLIRGVPLAERLNHRFLVATHSHFRASADTWEKLHWPAGIKRIDRRDWPVIETGLSLREECLYFIQEHGGITRASGARLDGRLRVAEAEADDEYRHVFHQPPFPRSGDGGRAEAPAEHRTLPG